MVRSEGQPNIVLIMADQLTSQVLSMYNPKGQAITPNLDSLAADGVVFDNAHCNSPLCTPSRASMFTGARTSTTEIWGNGSIFPPDIPTMMHFLRSAGYRNVVSGKTHFVGPDQLHGFDKRLTTDMYPSRFDWTIDWTRGVEHKLGTSAKKLEISGLCRTNNQILFDTEVQFRAIEFLRYEALNQSDDPFFLHVSFTQPHDSYQSIPKYWDLYNDIDIAMPEQPEDAESDAHITTKWLKHHHGIDAYPPSPDTIRDSRRAYCAMITHLDEYVGELISELKLLDLYDDTIVIFCSDHGDMIGERNMWFKRTFYDMSVKVPLIFHSPSRFPAARVEQCVTLADLCPTLAELAGAKQYSDLHGSNDSDSFANLLAGNTDGARDSAISEYFGGGVIEPWLMLRQDGYKYVYTRNHQPVLFDMINDPNETRNLIGDPVQAERIARMHRVLFDGLDLDAKTERAVASKVTRTYLHQALKTSEGYHWDYQPVFDATQQYVREANDPVTI